MADTDATQYFRDVPARVSSDDIERDILAYWDDKHIFERSCQERVDKPLFSFYDGPPYATGKPHYGHVLQSSIKDTILRYKTMRGYYVPRRVGWDCHGLPVENIVEKEKGYATKKDIEKDIEGFNAACRKTTKRYVQEFTDTIKRIGRWADYDNAYATLDRTYMESEWWVFRQLWDDGLVYKDFRSTPYCVRCATPLSNFEVSMAYKEKVDTAVYVLFPVQSHDNTYLLVWTTTPWTLPGNVAVAFSPDIAYVTVEHEGKRIVIASDRVADVFGEDSNVVHTWDAKELAELTYTSPYPQESEDALYTVVPAGHVTADDGTGLVHTAPAFGEEDAHVASDHGLPTLRVVDSLGKYFDSVPKWGGEHIFDANARIVDDLKERELLLRDEQYPHSYPFCWRCDTPLIYYALDTWFVAVTKIKEQMLENNEKINWVPEHIKRGRFAKGIESAPDWAVSRNRFWSTPVPIWECNACEERICISSVQELLEYSGVSEKDVEDLHRPYVDRITWKCASCDGVMHRVSEVLDVWFDSASMPYAQWHYPFENTERVEQGYPADFIVESIEMTRAWFYVLHVLATALTRTDRGLGVDVPAYKNVIASGLIFAEDGQKLSKKLKNYPEIDPVLETYGADALRFYLLSSASLGEPYRFSEKDMRSLRQNTYVTLWNVYSFFTRYANVHKWDPSKKDETPSEHVLDQWIMARMTRLEQDVISHLDAYHVDSASRQFISFIDDMSNWYVRRCRQRFQPAGGGADNAAFSTLYDVLVRTSKLLAPFMPFVSEEMYRNLTQGDSVHLEFLPDASDLHMPNEDEKLLEVMKTTRDVVSEGLALRARNSFKVRQPLAALYVETEDIPEELMDIVRQEVNVKDVVRGPIPEHVVRTPEDSAYAVGLDIEITDELREEGIARDIVRHGQLLRRKAGYGLHDRIAVVLRTSDEDLQRILHSQQAYITEMLQADEVVDEAQEDAGEDVRVGDVSLHVGVVRAAV